jgi:predicted component of type VI protein secretion system
LRTFWPSFSRVANDLFSIDASISKLISSVIEQEPVAIPFRARPYQQSLANKLSNKALPTNHYPQNIASNLANKNLTNKT